VFFPSSSRSVDNYGVIEIKRPSSKIVTKVREDVAILSRDARTAAAQTIKYSQSLPSRNIDERRSIFLGNDLHLFVIMGLADELEKLSPSLLRLVEEQLPRNLRLYPYDVLLHEFELSLPRKIMALATTTERARTRVDMRVSSDTAEKLNHVSGLTGISKSALVGTALRMADPRNDRTLGKELAGGTRQLSVRLPRQTADSLRKLSKETGVPQREIVRHAMRLLLETPAMTSLINAVENAEQMLDQ
jgi:predicted DNA-binding protein